ncbi:MAG: hypothetical protein V1899_01825 [Planctomycetota bacterium]
MRTYFRNLAAAPLSLLLFWSLCGVACAETVDFKIQSVTATEPGKKPVKIADSLTKYKEILESYNFGVFKDAGCDNCKITIGADGKNKKSKSSAKNCVSIGIYTIEIALTKVEKDVAKVTVTIYEKKQVVYAPIAYCFKKSQARPIEIASKDASTIFILTLESLE